MKIKIRRNGKYICVIEAVPIALLPDSLMDHVRDVTDWNSCVLKSDDGESAIHDFDGAEHFILVQLNDEMLHQCAAIMGGAVDHLINDLVEYLRENEFSPVPA
jgi:hypothetical protein